MEGGGGVWRLGDLKQKISRYVTRYTTLYTGTSRNAFSMWRIYVSTFQVIYFLKLVECLYLSLFSFFIGNYDMSYCLRYNNENIKHVNARDYVYEIVT